MSGISDPERSLFLIQSSLGALDTAIQPLDANAQRQLASKLDRGALLRAQDAIAKLLEMHDNAPPGGPPVHPPSEQGSPHVGFKSLPPPSSVPSSPGNGMGLPSTNGGSSSCRPLTATGSSKHTGSMPHDSAESTAQGRRSPDGVAQDTRSLYLDKLFGQLAEVVSQLSHGDELAAKWDPQQQTWKPTPPAIDAIQISPVIHALVEQCASNLHRRWLVEQKRAGWRYGRMRNEDEKRAPNICNYRQLPEEEKVMHRGQAEFVVKIVTAMGYTFVEDNESRVIIKSTTANLLKSPGTRARRLTRSATSGVIKKANAFVGGFRKVAPEAPKPESRVDVTTGFAHHPARKWLDIERI